MCLVVAPFLYSQDKKGVDVFLDNSALKTNVFEWLITVPNIGFEYDVYRTEFKKMTVGLTAKYNWNSYHKLTPSTAFDMLDVRPEFRYYIRTKDVKYSKRWWTIYMGPYLSYGNYTFKLAPKGIHGYSFGAGASLGYVMPMYEYKKGAIDLELGFSLGLQACTRDVFTYNPEGHYYTKSDSESKGLHFTPFPIVSELRVAFAWRRHSIRYQVMIDEERLAYLKVEKKSLENYYSKFVVGELGSLRDSLMFDRSREKGLYLKDGGKFDADIRYAVDDLLSDLNRGDGQLRTTLGGPTQKYKASLDSLGIMELDARVEKKIGRLKKDVIDRALYLVREYGKEYKNWNPETAVPVRVKALRTVLKNWDNGRKVYVTDVNTLFKEYVTETIPFHLNDRLMYREKADSVLKDSILFNNVLQAKANRLLKQDKNELRKSLAAASDRYKATLDSVAAGDMAAMRKDSLAIEKKMDALDATVEKAVLSLKAKYEGEKRNRLRNRRSKEE